MSRVSPIRAKQFQSLTTGSRVSTRHERDMLALAPMPRAVFDQAGDQMNGKGSTLADLVAERFGGIEGPRLLRAAILRQPLALGDPALAAALADAASIKAFNAGELLLTQGATDTHFCLILSGSVIVSPNGRDDTVRAAGTHVGEMSTIDPSVRRSADVRAVEPTVAACIAEADFARIADANPRLWRYLAAEMAERLRQRVRTVPARKLHPRIIIASSKESLSAAQSLKSQIGDAAAQLDVFVWTEGIFTAGDTNIEALEQELQRADFAAVVLSPDDQVISRGQTSDAPRDNLILELGMFVGALGRRRALMLCPEGTKIKLPTDLLGVVPIRYRADDITAAVTEFLEIVRRLGPK